MMHLSGVLTSAAVLASITLPGSWAVPSLPEGPDCVSKGETGPLQVTADCVDPMYNTPFIDRETDESLPVPHRKVSGHFNGTNVEFNIILPPAEQWHGRFFHRVYPLQDSVASDQEIAFGADSGAYALRVTGTFGYRADAAAAKFAKEVAKEYYQHSGNIYGYIYGGSGGSFMTVGAMENTFGVWDGALTLVQGSPFSIPNNWSIRALAGLVLRSKIEQVRDALSPGGSGNPFDGLTNAERSVLAEATALGVPLFAWEEFERAGLDGGDLFEKLRSLVIRPVRSADPTYANDFWSGPGFIGTEDSELGEIFRGALVDFTATVADVTFGEDGIAVEVELEELSEVRVRDNLEFTILDGSGELRSFFGFLGNDTQTVTIYQGEDAEVLSQLDNGTELRVDNSWHLAVHGYHRHQVPILDGTYGYDYLRNDEGRPLYPQRDILLGPPTAKNVSGGGDHSGNITGKMIVLNNLRDHDALPWHGDWYRNQVRKALGDRFEDNFRIIFNENADHYMFDPIAKERQTRMVSFVGIIEQVLKDLSAWAEEDIAPTGTRYTVNNGQVELPASASERLGIQPVVRLTIDGGNRTEVSTGNSVTFDLHVEVPPGTGQVVAVEWDFFGTGDFVAGSLGDPAEIVDMSVSQIYDQAGVYFPSARVTSHRDGNSKTPFNQAKNLGRARVVVN